MAWGCGAIVNTPHGDKMGALPTGSGVQRTTIHHCEVRVLLEGMGHTCTKRQREGRARIPEVQSLLRPLRRAKPTHCERVPEGVEADVGTLRPLLRAESWVCSKGTEGGVTKLL